MGVKQRQTGLRKPSTPPPCRFLSDCDPWEMFIFSVQSTANIDSISTSMLPRRLQSSFPLNQFVSSCQRNVRRRNVARRNMRNHRGSQKGGAVFGENFYSQHFDMSHSRLIVLPSQSFSSNKLSFRRYNIQQTQATAFQILFQSPNLKLSKPGQFPVVYFLNALYLLHTLRGVIP